MYVLGEVPLEALTSAGGSVTTANVSDNLSNNEEQVAESSSDDGKPVTNFLVFCFIMHVFCTCIVWSIILYYFEASKVTCSCCIKADLHCKINVR